MHNEILKPNRINLSMLNFPLNFQRLCQRWRSCIFRRGRFRRLSILFVVFAPGRISTGVLRSWAGEPNFEANAVGTGYLNNSNQSKNMNILSPPNFVSLNFVLFLNFVSLFLSPENERKLRRRVFSIFRVQNNEINLRRNA